MPSGESAADVVKASHRPQIYDLSAIDMAALDSVQGEAVLRQVTITRDLANLTRMIKYANPALSLRALKRLKRPAFSSQVRAQNEATGGRYFDDLCRCFSRNPAMSDVLAAMRPRFALPVASKLEDASGAEAAVGPATTSVYYAPLVIQELENETQVIHVLKFLLRAGRWAETESLYISSVVISSPNVFSHFGFSWNRKGLASRVFSLIQATPAGAAWARARFAKLMALYRAVCEDPARKKDVLAFYDEGFVRPLLKAARLIQDMPIVEGPCWENVISLFLTECGFLTGAYATQYLSNGGMNVIPAYSEEELRGLEADALTSALITDAKKHRGPAGAAGAGQGGRVYPHNIYLAGLPALQVLYIVLSQYSHEISNSKMEQVLSIMETRTMLDKLLALVPRTGADGKEHLVLRSDFGSLAHFREIARQDACLSRVLAAYDNPPGKAKSHGAYSLLGESHFGKFPWFPRFTGAAHSADQAEEYPSLSFSSNVDSCRFYQHFGSLDSGRNLFAYHTVQDPREFDCETAFSFQAFLLRERLTSAVTPGLHGRFVEFLQEAATVYFLRHPPVREFRTPREAFDAVSPNLLEMYSEAFNSIISAPSQLSPPTFSDLRLHFSSSTTGFFTTRYFWASHLVIKGLISGLSQLGSSTEAPAAIRKAPFLPKSIAAYGVDAPQVPRYPHTGAECKFAFEKTLFSPNYNFSKNPNEELRVALLEALYAGLSFTMGKAAISPEERAFYSSLPAARSFSIAGQATEIPLDEVSAADANELYCRVIDYFTAIIKTSKNDASVLGFVGALEQCLQGGRLLFWDRYAVQGREFAADCPGAPESTIFSVSFDFAGLSDFYALAGPRLLALARAIFQKKGGAEAQYMSSLRVSLTNACHRIALGYLNCLPTDFALSPSAPQDPARAEWLSAARLQVFTQLRGFLSMTAAFIDQLCSAAPGRLPFAELDRGIWFKPSEAAALRRVSVFNVFSLVSELVGGQSRDIYQVSRPEYGLSGFDSQGRRLPKSSRYSKDAFWLAKVGAGRPELCSFAKIYRSSVWDGTLLPSVAEFLSILRRQPSEKAGEAAVASLARAPFESLRDRAQDLLPTVYSGPLLAAQLSALVLGEEDFARLRRLASREEGPSGAAESFFVLAMCLPLTLVPAGAAKGGASGVGSGREPPAFPVETLISWCCAKASDAPRSFVHRFTVAEQGVLQAGLTRAAVQAGLLAAESTPYFVNLAGARDARLAQAAEALVLPLLDLLVPCAPALGYMLHTMQRNKCLADWALKTQVELPKSRGQKAGKSGDADRRDDYSAELAALVSGAEAPLVLPQPDLDGEHGRATEYVAGLPRDGKQQLISLSPERKGFPCLQALVQGKDAAPRPAECAEACRSLAFLYAKRVLEGASPATPTMSESEKSAVLKPAEQKLRSAFDAFQTGCGELVQKITNEMMAAIRPKPVSPSSSAASEEPLPALLRKLRAQLETSRAKLAEVLAGDARICHVKVAYLSDKVGVKLVSCLPQPFSLFQANTGGSYYLNASSNLLLGWAPDEHRHFSDQSAFALLRKIHAHRRDVLCLEQSRADLAACLALALDLTGLVLEAKKRVLASLEADIALCNAYTAAVIRKAGKAELDAARAKTEGIATFPPGWEAKAARAPTVLIEPEPTSAKEFCQWNVVVLLTLFLLVLQASDGYDRGVRAVDREFAAARFSSENPHAAFFASQVSGDYAAYVRFTDSLLSGDLTLSKALELLRGKPLAAANPAGASEAEKQEGKTSEDHAADSDDNTDSADQSEETEKDLISAADTLVCKSALSKDLFASLCTSEDALAHGTVLPSIAEAATEQGQDTAIEQGEGQDEASAPEAVSKEGAAARDVHAESRAAVNTHLSSAEPPVSNARLCYFFHYILQVISSAYPHVSAKVTSFGACYLGTPMRSLPLLLFSGAEKFDLLTDKIHAILSGTRKKASRHLHGRSAYSRRAAAPAAHASYVKGKFTAQSIQKLKEAHDKTLTCVLAELILFCSTRTRDSRVENYLALAAVAMESPLSALFRAVLRSIKGMTPVQVNPLLPRYLYLMLAGDATSLGNLKKIMDLLGALDDGANTYSRNCGAFGGAEATKATKAAGREGAGGAIEAIGASGTSIFADILRAAVLGSHSPDVFTSYFSATLQGLLASDLDLSHPQVQAFLGIVRAGAGNVARQRILIRLCSQSARILLPPNPSVPVLDLDYEEHPKQKALVHEILRILFQGRNNPLYSSDERLAFSFAQVLVGERCDFALRSPKLRQVIDACIDVMTYHVIGIPISGGAKESLPSEKELQALGVGVEAFDPAVTSPSSAEFRYHSLNAYSSKKKLDWFDARIAAYVSRKYSFRWAQNKTLRDLIGDVAALLVSEYFLGIFALDGSAENLMSLMRYLANYLVYFRSALPTHPNAPRVASQLTLSPDMVETEYRTIGSVPAEPEAARSHPAPLLGYLCIHASQSNFVDATLQYLSQSCLHHCPTAKTVSLCAQLMEDLVRVEMALSLRSVMACWASIGYLANSILESVDMVCINERRLSGAVNASSQPPALVSTPENSDFKLKASAEELRNPSLLHAIFCSFVVMNTFNNPFVDNLRSLQLYFKENAAEVALLGDDAPQTGGSAEPEAVSAIRKMLGKRAYGNEYLVLAMIARAYGWKDLEHRIVQGHVPYRDLSALEKFGEDFKS